MIIARIKRSAFTLVELLVAVAVVALLTIGVGQIFQSVSALSSTGSAVAEVESAARVIENLMRDDFSSLSRVDPEKNFLAIRNRRLGDLNQNQSFDSTNEVALYISQDDAEFDQRNSFDPYQTNSDGRILSRATTVRLDEIMFIGFSNEPGGYVSYQQDNAGRATIRSPFARIYYGHGLKPPIDIPDNADDPTLRLYYADGDFGSGPDAQGPAHYNTNNRFRSTGAMRDPTGRNQYAGDFVLTRQPLLLFGGTAPGYDTAGTRESPLAVDQSFVPFIRDLESEFRIFGLSSVGPIGSIVDQYPSPLSPETRPNIRINRHGRTDVCAQSLEDVIRWLEGRVDPDTELSGDISKLADATAFSSGLFNEPDPNDINMEDRMNHVLDRWLWERFFSSEFINNGLQNSALLHNLKGKQSAIAGMFSRPIVDPQPPVLRSEDPEALINAGQRPAEANMDLHAILARHCSSFEVAWSDGTRWEFEDELDYNRASDDAAAPPRRILREGDILWFDMDFTYADLYEAAQEVGADLREAKSRYPRPNPDPEIHLDGFDATPDILSPLGFPQGIQYRPITGPYAQRRLAATNGFDAAPPTFIPGFKSGSYFLPTYSQFYTHGAPAFDEEYLAIWGFRRPEGASESPLTRAGGYTEEAWPKPSLIRIRMTLHDSQKRLRSGKTFEFVFRINNEL